MLILKINNFQFQVKANISVLDACKFVGVEISRFCYHELLSISGNCRMCLVELDKAPKPVASCVTLVNPGMQIYVLTPFVKKARELIVEMLLINHPLDCPICDQGGECDLQDQVKIVGNDYNKFWFNKKVVEDKKCGPIIKTIMTRCIHCTRCVRFSSEIAGDDSFGTLGRGKGTEIGFYSSKMFLSEISGNVIDLCPVGALTSKPYAFKVRPWEILSVETIDLSDGLGSSVSIELKKDKIVRVLPKKNIFLNESLITDKARYSYDSTYTNRLNNITDKNNNILNWSSILKSNSTNNILEDKNLILINSEELSLENLIFLKTIEVNKPNNIKIRNILPNTNYSNFYINNTTSISKTLNNIGKVCIVFSSNLKIENAIINIQIRNKFVKSQLDIYNVGQKHILNNRSEQRFLALNISSIIKLAEGKFNTLSSVLLSTKNLFIVFGGNLDTRILNINKLKFSLLKANPTIKFLNINLNSNTEGSNLCSIKSISKKDITGSTKIFYLNLSENILVRKLVLLNNKLKKTSYWFNPFIFFSSSKTTFCIPTNSSFEESGIYINLEKRSQQSVKAVFGLSKTLPQLIVEFFNIDYKNLKRRTHFNFVLEIVKSQNIFNTLIQNKYKFISIFKNFETTKILEYPIKASIEDFYTNNLNTKNSIIMNKCSKELRNKKTNF